MNIRKELLQVLFDVAVESMDFGSGFLDDEEVKALREVAELLGVDPVVATPNNMQCKFGSPHEVYGASASAYRNMCWKCKRVLTDEEVVRAVQK